MSFPSLRTAPARPRSAQARRARKASRRTLRSSELRCELLEDRRLLAAVPTIAIDDVQQMEGDDGTTDFVFTVTRSGRTNKPSTVDWVTSPGSATPGVDYQPSDGTLTFERGETTKTIAVPVFGDGIDEADETFFVDLTIIDNGQFGDNRGVGTIVNDDMPLALSISDATLAEGGPTSEAFVTAGSGGLDGPCGVTIGPDGNLYVLSQGNDSVIRYDGSTGEFIDVFVSSGSGGLDFPHDAMFGPDGNLYVTSRDTHSVLKYHGTTGAFVDDFITPESGGDLQNPRGLLFSDDGFLYVTSVDGDDANQGTGDAVLRYDASTGEFDRIFVSSGSGGLDNPTRMAIGPDDDLYVSSTSSTSNAVLRYDGSSGTFIDTFIASGSGGLNGPVDLLFHTDGFLYVSATRSDNVLRYDSATGSYVDTPIDSSSGELDAPRDLVSAADGGLYVSSAATDEIRRFSQTITISLTATSDQIVTVDYSSGDGTAVAGSDYTEANGTVTFAPSETTKKILLVANDDIDIENNETFTVTLFNATGGATIADSQGVVTITDDDSARQISIDDQITAEGDATPHYRGAFVYSLPSVNFNDNTFGPDGMFYASPGPGPLSNTINQYNGTNGAFIRQFVPAGYLSGARDIVFQGDYMYVGSEYTDEVLRFHKGTGEFDSVFVTAENGGGIDGPHGLAFGPDTNSDNIPELYVTGRNSFNVIRYDGATGQPLGA